MKAKSIFQQPMSQKQFLVYLVLAVVSITGISGLIDKVLRVTLNPEKLTVGARLKKSFGNGPYGGVKT